MIIYSIALAKAWHHRRILAPLLNPLNENPFATTITTEIEVIITRADGRESVTKRERGNHQDMTLGTADIFDGQHHRASTGKIPYNVNIQGDSSLSEQERLAARPELFRIPSLTRKAALAESNAEGWLYARVAFLYFLVMMICWIPASINRLYSLIHPHTVIFALNYVAIIFLPLQGALNAAVYCVSSQTGVKRLFSNFGMGLGRGEGGRRGSGRRARKDAERISDSDPSSDGGFVFQDRGGVEELALQASRPMAAHHTLDPHTAGPYWGNSEARVKEVAGSENSDSIRRDGNMV